MATEDDAWIGYGNTIGIGDGADPEVFTLVAYVIAVTPAVLTTSDVDVTHSSSPDAAMEYIPGLLDATTFTAECLWVPSHATQDNTTGLLSVWRTRAVKNWQFTFADADAATEIVRAYINNVSRTTPLDAAVKATVTWKVTGLPTLAS